MGQRGPKPTPTNVLALRGSWRAKRNPKEPRPELGRPRRPQWLNGEAKATWDRLAKRLDAMGVLAKIDEHALARYCTLWARWRKAEDFLAQHGDAFLAKDAGGNVKGLKPYPQVRIAAQLAEQLLRLEQQFGLTPSARARLEAAPLPEDDTDDKRRYLRVGGVG